MRVLVSAKKAHETACDALIIPVFKGKETDYSIFGKEIEGIISKASTGTFKAEELEICQIDTLGGIRAGRILLTGLGESASISSDKIRKCGGRVAALASGSKLKRLALITVHLTPLNLSPVPFIEGVLLGSYSFNRYRKENASSVPQSVSVIAKRSRALLASIQDAVKRAEAVHFTRDLVNTPSNYLTPSEMAAVAKGLQGKKTKVSILNRSIAKRAGMEAFLAVSKGSAEDPRFIVIEYKGAGGRPVVLIGKSVTFDSGGISLKPSAGMEKMKYDMAGGAAVLGVMKYISETAQPLHIVAILPATENLPGGSATRPGDIVRAVTGKTIEVINTDAEGRLTLADAIGFAGKYRPEAVIDIATLTGACDIALGAEAAALMSNNDDLINSIKKASDETGEKVWQMPLYDEYSDYIKSDIADLKNVGGRSGSLVAAGYFLKEFAGDTPWAHLDIASTAWTDKGRPYTPRGATGTGVRLLISYLHHYLN